jgi:hypothetical protein
MKYLILLILLLTASAVHAQPAPLTVTVYTTLTTPAHQMDVTVATGESGTVQVVPWGERTGGTMTCDGRGVCQGPGTVSIRIGRNAGVASATQNGRTVWVRVDAPTPEPPGPPPGPTATPEPVLTPRVVLVPVWR